MVVPKYGTGDPMNQALQKKPVVGPLPPVSHLPGATIGPTQPTASPAIQPVAATTMPVNRAAEPGTAGHVGPMEGESMGGATWLQHPPGSRTDPYQNGGWGPGGPGVGLQDPLVAARQGTPPPGSGTGGQVGPRAAVMPPSATGPGAGTQPRAPEPSAPPAAQGALPGMTAFDPQNNLIGQQINPQGTNREQLAQDYFKNLIAQGQPGFEQNLREITQRNAAGGRLGSGMYGTNLVDAATQYQNNLANQAAGLAYNAGSAQIGDQQAAEAALRGERGYQYGLSQDATQQAIQQKLIEDQLLNSDFGRQQQVLGNLINTGFNGNPSGVVLGGAAQTQAAANQGGQNLYDMLAQYFQHRNTQAPAGG